MQKYRPSLAAAIKKFEENNQIKDKYKTLKNEWNIIDWFI